VRDARPATNADHRPYCLFLSRQGAYEPYDYREPSAWLLAELRKRDAAVIPASDPTCAGRTTLYVTPVKWRGNREAHVSAGSTLHGNVGPVGYTLRRRLFGGWRIVSVEVGD
jgi:hypothetical protein